MRTNKLGVVDMLVYLYHTEAKKKLLIHTDRKVFETPL